MIARGSVRLRLMSAAALLALLPVPANAEADKDRRYNSPSGAFSVSMDDLSGRRMAPGKEDVTGDTVVVDFTSRLVNVPFLSQRTVEWIKLDKPIDPQTYDAQATALVSGYLEARFGQGKLEVADRGKFRDREGRLIYAFAAKGEVQQLPAYWQGVVLFFDRGVALESELLAQPTQHKFESSGGVVLRGTVDWAMSIRPGA